MSKNINPFSNYGSIVFGDNFVGRKDAIRSIQQRIINSPDPACLAIIEFGLSYFDLSPKKFVRAKNS
jgi:hypothetical protein